MNNRMQELADQANSNIVVGTPFPLAFAEFSRNYAKLIVLECMDLCVVETSGELTEYQQGVVEGYRRARENMKEFFEVNDQDD